MEVSTAISDAISAATSQGLALSKSLLPRPSSRSLSVLAASILSVGSAAPRTTVRSDSPRALAPRALLRRTRRTRRRSLTEDGGEDGFSGDGDGDDGPFGGGGGGRGWGFGGSGGPDWEEAGSGSSSSSDPAFDFVYEVMCWIALSNCAHFALKRMGRRLLEGRGKEVPIRLVPSVC